ncbi:MAG TPA: hypothetical protein VHC48_18990, partial [Puia sp.]|nr:hypothetical protein [Puia sp.]
FTGRISSLHFSVHADGSSPAIEDIAIEGHDEITATIAKETSDQVVKCYLGSFSGHDPVHQLDSKGVFDVVIFGSSIIGVAKDTLMHAMETLDGTAAGNSINAGTVSSGATFTGTFNSDGCSGTWNNNTNGAAFTGTWSGKRASF